MEYMSGFYPCPCLLGCMELLLDCMDGLPGCTLSADAHQLVTDVLMSVVEENCQADVVSGVGGLQLAVVAWHQVEVLRILELVAVPLDLVLEVDQQHGYVEELLQIVVVPH